MANSIIVGVLAAAISFIYFGYPILVTQEVWLYIACTVWILSCGGIIYVRMENPELYGHHTEKDKHGNDIVIVDEWIKPERGEQYGYEGFIASSIFTLIGILFVFMI